MFGAKYRKEGRGYHKSVSLLSSLVPPSADGWQYSLLEVFGVLESVNAVKDPESVHYESLVKEYERLVSVICEDHICAANTHIRDKNICSNLIKEVEAECKEIVEYRIAAERWHLEIDSRSKDRLISFGEKLSCRFVAALLEDRASRMKFNYGFVRLTNK